MSFQVVLEFSNNEIKNVLVSHCLYAKYMKQFYMRQKILEKKHRFR